MKKVLVVSDTYHPNIDGIVVFLKNVLPELKKLFNIHILSLNVGRRPKKDETLLDVSKFNYHGSKLLKFSFKNIKKIKQQIKQNEVIWIQGPSMLSMLAAHYGRKYHKRVIYYVHVIPWEAYEGLSRSKFRKKWIGGLIKKMTLYQYNLCNEVLVPYHELAEHLRESGCTSTLKVVKLGVDTDKFKPPEDKLESKKKIKISPNKFVIGYIGRISKEKNVHTLLKAFKELQDQKNLHLLLVGDGTKSQVKPFKSLSNCTITGFVNDVEKYVQAMDLFVMPSMTETTSFATLEAMSTGLPVISSKVGFIKTYLTKDHNGVFFAKNSSHMLAMKIEKLRENPELREKLGENARRTITYSFSWKKSIDKLKEILAYRT